MASPEKSPNPDPVSFYELVSTKKIPTHRISHSTNPDTPLYTVKTYESLSRKKPGIVLHAGDSKSSPVAGVVRMHSKHAKFHTIGIGNPDAIMEDDRDENERMVWERLQRMKKWSYRWYEFEFGGQVYTWRRTADRWLRSLRDMELRVGKKEDGELVAAWRGTSRMNVKRGSFFIKRRDEGVEGVEGDRFETMTLLTGLAIIEGFMRRAR